MCRTRMSDDGPAGKTNGSERGTRAARVYTCYIYNNIQCIIYGFAPNRRGVKPRRHEGSARGRWEKKIK